MGVQMRNLDPRRLKLTNLGYGFGLNLLRTDAMTQEESKKRRELAMEMFCSGFHQVGDLIGWKQRNTIDQHYMATQLQRRCGAADLQGMVEGWCGCHRSSRGQDAAVVSLQDRVIYAWRKAEVIRIDDEASQG